VGTASEDAERRGSRGADEKASAAYDSRGDAGPGSEGKTESVSTAKAESADWMSGERARGFQPPERIDVLQLPRNLIGRIIGKGGATIKDIRERSGARIDARDQSEDPVQVLISGTKGAVETAKALLLDVAEGAAVSAGAEGLAAAVAVVTAPSVGAPGTGARSRSGWSTDPPAAAAPAAAAAAVPAAAASTDAPARETPVATPAGSTTAADPASGGGGEAAGATVATDTEGASAAKPGPLVQEHMELPYHATGKIIGTKGQQIAEVRQRSGAQVDVDKSPVGCRVRIVGTQEQVSAAKEFIAKITDPGHEGELMEISRSAVGRIIGAGGARIQELQERSGAKIDIDRGVEPCLIRFAGFPENVAYAKKLVVEVLEGRDRTTFGEAAVNIEVPPSCTGRLIGPGGRQINEIQETSGAKVDIDKSRDPCIVRMTGSHEAVTRAEAMVRQVVQAIGAQPRSGGGAPQTPLALAAAARPAGVAFDEETINFEIPAVVAGKLLGDGAWIRALEQRTGARAVVRHHSGGGCHLELSGQPEQVVEAEQLAEDAVRCLNSLGPESSALQGGGSPSMAPGAQKLVRPPAPALAPAPVPVLALPTPAPGPPLPAPPPVLPAPAPAPPAPSLPAPVPPVPALHAPAPTLPAPAAPVPAAAVPAAATAPPAAMAPAAATAPAVAAVPGAATEPVAAAATAQARATAPAAAPTPAVEAAPVAPWALVAATAPAETTAPAAATAPVAAAPAPTVSVAALVTMPASEGPATGPTGGSPATSPNPSGQQTSSGQMTATFPSQASPAQPPVQPPVQPAVQPPQPQTQPQPQLQPQPPAPRPPPPPPPPPPHLGGMPPTWSDGSLQMLNVAVAQALAADPSTRPCMPTAAGFASGPGLMPPPPPVAVPGMYYPPPAFGVGWPAPVMVPMPLPPGAGVPGTAPGPPMATGLPTLPLGF